MNIRFVFFVVLLAASACKSSYEKIRTSNDAALQFKAANDFYKKKDYVRAQALYELALSSYRGQKEAEELYYNYADCHYQLREYEMAAHLYKNFASTFINSPLKETAEFNAAQAIYKTSPNYRLDQSGTIKAIDAFQSFVNTYPESPKVAESNKLIDELRAKLEKKAYEQGKLYLDIKNYQAAISTFENLLTDFPDTKNDREVRYLIPKSMFLLAENSIFEKQKERYVESVNKSEYFLNRYPTGTYSKEVIAIKKEANKKHKNPEYDRYQNTGDRNKS